MQLNKSHPKEYNLPDLEIEFWAYLAGFIDGEGHIRKSIIRETSVGYNYLYEIQISQNRENHGQEIFEEFQKKLGIGFISTRKMEKRNKDVLYFSIRRRMAIVKILKKILPFSRVKKEKIIELLKYIEDTYGFKEKDLTNITYL